MFQVTRNRGSKLLVRKLSPTVDIDMSTDPIGKTYSLTVLPVVRSTDLRKGVRRPTGCSWSWTEVIALRTFLLREKTTQNHCSG